MNGRYDELAITPYDPIIKKNYANENAKKVNEKYEQYLYMRNEELTDLKNILYKFKEIDGLRDAALKKIEEENNKNYIKKNKMKTKIMPEFYNGSIPFYRITNYNIRNRGLLAKEVGWEKYHSYIYSTLSGWTHSTNATIRYNSVLHRPEIKDVTDILDYIMIFGITVLHEVSEKLIFNNKNTLEIIHEMNKIGGFKEENIVLHSDLNAILRTIQAIGDKPIEVVESFESAQELPEEERLVVRYGECYEYKLRDGVTDEQLEERYNNFMAKEFFILTCKIGKKYNINI